MHEVSVVSDIVSAILKELEKYNVEKVEEVILVVGEMTSLGDEQLEFAYEIVTKETKLEGSKLVIEHEKIRVRCNECGYEGEVRMLESDYGEHTIPILSCPKCNGRVKVTAGQTCMVKNLKIVEAE
ncbi:MAG: hydrogenase maturation nickel metallochaperone HypA [Candidatus Methanomethylophilaceae archaeon]|nr:hydrogenase maturation nickel metallochaperone HypA [Candidatus Methanomethylophilaceae archaeon]